MAGHLNHEFYFDGLSPIEERGGAGPREGERLPLLARKRRNLCILQPIIAL